MSADQKPYKLRLPRIEQSEIMKIMNVQSTEFEYWKRIMEHPGRYAENLFFATVPELFAAELTFYNKVLALITGLDPELSGEEIGRLAVTYDEPLNADHARFFFMCCWLFCVHTPNEFARVVTAGMHGPKLGLTSTKLLLLDHPDSDVWTDDERLSLKFVKAAFNFEMTDELWDAAAEAWGVPWIMNALTLLCYYYGSTVRYEAVGLDRIVGLRGDIPVTEQLG